jgi:hypothetical protein
MSDPFRVCKEKIESQDRYIKRLEQELRSFPEDYQQENGNYLNKCFRCLQEFVGHKDRSKCRACTHGQSDINGKIKVWGLG